VHSGLRSPRIRRILAAYTVNRLGTWIGLVALSLAVFDHTHSAIAVAALLVAGQVLPAFAVPAVVARVEASSRRGELSGLYVFEAIATGVLAILILHFWLPAVLLVVALDGTAALAASALLRTAIARAAREDLAATRELSGEGGGRQEPQEDRKEEEHAAEQKANAALNVAFSATFVMGPAAGGALVAGAGASTALIIDAASFLICGALLVDLHPHVEEAAGASVAARLRAAWSYVQAAPALKALLLTQAVALVFFESAGPIEVAYAKATLHAGDGGYGLLVATWGAGVVLGSIVFARAGSRSLGTLMSAGTLGVGLAYVGFAAAPSLAVGCAAALLGGLGNGVQWAPLISAVQRLTPPRLQGRVMGGLESIGALTPALGLTLGGALVALASPRIAFLVVGVGASLTTFGFARIVLPAGAEPDRPETAGDRVDGRSASASPTALGEPSQR
jgi:hypothetical protein